MQRFVLQLDKLISTKKHVYILKEILGTLTECCDHIPIYFHINYNGLHKNGMKYHVYFKK